MSKHKKLNHKPEENILHDLPCQDGLEKALESNLLNNLDEGRREFLKKLLISAVYVTPAVLTFSMRDADAKKFKKKIKPTRKGKGKGKGRGRGRDDGSSDDSS